MTPIKMAKMSVAVSTEVMMINDCSEIFRGCKPLDVGGGVPVSTPNKSVSFIGDSGLDADIVLN
jgi:hypothetical protein